MQRVEVTEVPAGAQLIDVRKPDEYAEVHAAGAVSIPLASVLERASEIDTSQDIYLICKAGVRSAKAGAALEAQGFQVINVEGGTDAWVAAGLPTG